MGSSVASVGNKAAGIRPGLGLDALRAVALGLTLFVVTWIGVAREQPPLMWLVQGWALLILGGWWGWKLARRQWPARSPLALPLVALALSAALATAFSVDTALSLAGLFEILTPILFFFVFCDLLLAGWKDEVLINALLIVATLLIAQGLAKTVTWYRGWWELRVPEYPTFPISYRLFGVADHPNLLAALINLALPFAILRLGAARRAAAQAGYALWLAAATVVLFYTRSRAGWAAGATTAALAVGWLLLERRPARWGDRGGWLRNTWRVWLMAAVYLGLFLALFAFESRPGLSELTTSGGSVSELAGRPLFWSVAWRDWMAHPLTGSGPRTYPYAYMASVAGTRSWVSPHAHNLYLNTLAEEGVLGLAALAWAVVAAALALAKGWLATPAADPAGVAGRRSLVVAAGAALVGCCLVHAQAEIPVWLPTNGLVVAMLLAVGLHAAGALQPGRRAGPGWQVAVVPVAVAAAYLLVRQDLGVTNLMHGFDLAMAGDWRGAARAMDAAVAADPGYAFHQMQRGYAYSVVADPLTPGSDPSAAGRALESYRPLLQRKPEYVPTLVNAAWLLGRAGAGDEADRLLATAVERGPDWALPALLLGERYAAEGRAAEAQALFETAFEREPQARDMAACRQSPACRAAASATMDAPAPHAAEVHRRARALLEQGRPGEALVALSDIPLASADPQPWLDRADAHRALGQYAEARYALRMAQVLGGDGTAQGALSRAALMLAQGQTEAAIAALEQTARPQIGGVSYDGLVFRRLGLPGLFPPSLDLLQRTPEDLAVYRELSELYAGAGRSADAAWAEGQARALAVLLGEGGGGR